ncbi:organophosphate reductase [Bifidobacterium pullorum]|uniref:Organophosphate reductase n=1 Tax=Bifidobacterium pullorum TaxID=78448 RepID=A0A7V8KRT0_9BIFI|nr:organophosphate reductase [Bifidobacterium pullorum]
MRDALEVGYRLIDTAQAYGNEAGVGKAIRESGLDRGDMFVTSKVWVSNMNYERAKASIDASLDAMGLDHIDLMLLHQAYGDYHGAWRALEEAYRDGKLRAIGVSNFYPVRLMDMCAFAEIPPMVNQVETHVFCQQIEAHENMNRLGVVHEAWGPFAEGRNNVFANPVLEEIGRKYGKSTAQVMLRWLIDRGVVPLPKSTHRERMAENLDVFDFTLDDADRSAIAAMDGGHPIIWDHGSVKVGMGLFDLIANVQLQGSKLY